jgi:hypothetical protein
MMQAMEDVVFNAKFITQALNVLKRVGPGNNDTAKLSAELNQMMEKTGTLLRTIMKESPEERKQHFLSTFLSLTGESMNNFTGLLYELHWMKNYLLDQKKPS